MCIRDRGGREECVVYSHWLRTILLQSWMVSKPAASRRNPSSRVTWCLLRTRPAFVLVCEDHLCHETEVLYEALVSMLRACIGLRLSYIPASAPGWRLRSSHTEQFSKNQSAPKLENRKTSPCSPYAPNLLHVLLSRKVG